MNLFERTTHGAFKAPLEVAGIEDGAVCEALGGDLRETVGQEIGLLDGVTEALDIERVLAGEQMPIHFGSAMNNFGVQNLLESFLEMAPPSAGRVSNGPMVDPEKDCFSGFVFKIQANMNPRHRDRAVFVRIVSGVFERDMQVIDQRSGKKVRLANAQKLFGQDRETPDTAHAGDIKRYQAGMEQLMKEGVAQACHVLGSAQAVSLLGAVGPLQFEVLKARLVSEYQVDTRLETPPWTFGQWLEEKVPDPVRSEPVPPKVQLPSGSVVAKDQDGHWVVLMSRKHLVGLSHERNEHLAFRDHANG